MQIDRRTALRRLAFVSAGAVFLPSCLSDHSKAAIVLKNLTIDADEERMLAELADTLIPSGGTPGAATISAHLFALKMMDECASPSDQARFMSGLKQFEKTASAMNGTSFAASASSQRERFLSSLESGASTDTDLNSFYSTFKRLVIHAYTSSQYYLTKVQVYELVPGRWHGCVPVTS